MGGEECTHCNTKREAIQTTKRALDAFQNLKKDIENISRQQAVKGDGLKAIDDLIDCIDACMTDIEQCPREKYSASKAGEAIRKFMERLVNEK